MRKYSEKQAQQKKNLTQQGKLFFFFFSSSRHTAVRKATNDVSDFFCYQTSKTMNRTHILLLLVSLPFFANARRLNEAKGPLLVCSLSFPFLVLFLSLSSFFPFPHSNALSLCPSLSLFLFSFFLSLVRSLSSFSRTRIMIV